MTDCTGHHPDTPPDADIGRLCVTCYSRLRRTLLELPAVANWLHVHIAANGHAGERVSGSREDPIPLRLDVLDLIGPDSRKPVGEMHPEYAPDQYGAEALRATVMYWARRVHDEGGFGWTDRNDLTGLVAWIAEHLSWVAAQDWVGEFNDDLWKATVNAHRLAPWREETRRDTQPCGRCGRSAIILHIAAGVRRCERRAGGCGWEEPLSDYALQALLPAIRQAG